MKNFFYPGDIDQIVAALGSTAKHFEGKTVLITGGGGFLGKYFVKTFEALNKNVLKKPCKVIALDNYITSTEHDLQSSEHITIRRHDVIDNYIPDAPIDYILHAAGIASPQFYRAYPLETLDVAVKGTRNMLNLAKENKTRILYFSSSEIYGDPDSKFVPTPEVYRGNVACIGPRACYDESKRLGETLCHIYLTQHDVHTNIVRPFNVYGPGMAQNDYRVLPNFAAKIVQEQHLVVYGAGIQTRTFCYVTDAINGFLRVLALGESGEPYNIGNPTPEISMLQLCEKLTTILKRPVKFDLRPYPDSYPGDEPMRRCPDISKARRGVGYEPTVSLDDGLTRFFRWAFDTYTKI